MKLNLRRPLAFFDIESTGVNVATDKIVELAVLKILPQGDEDFKVWRINPGMPIPIEASLIHNIYDADVAELEMFHHHAKDIFDFINDADLAGYNSNKFDIPLLLEEFLRAGYELDMATRKMVDVQNIFHQMESRTLKAAYKFYCQKELVNAHSAEADIRATYEVLLSQLERYAETDHVGNKGVTVRPVVNDVEALHKFTNLHNNYDFAGRIALNNDNVPVINFGKHKGVPVEDVFAKDPSYYSWMMNGDFPLYTKKRLESLWAAWNAKRNNQQRNFRQGSNNPSPENNYPRPSQPKPYQQGRQQGGNNNVRESNSQSQYKKAAPSAPLTNDMLDQLRLKFNNPEQDN